MRFRTLIQLSVLLSTLFTLTTTRADWLNLTGAETAPNIAEIYILDDRVKLVLEVYIGDLERFQALLPDDWLSESNIKRPPAPERLRQFSEQTFSFVTETGERLQAQLKRVEPRMRTDRKSPYAGMINPLTRQRVPEAPADKRVLYAELIYPFSAKPKQLTIVPPLDDEGRASVTMGFIAYHKTVPIIDFRYLGTPTRLLLDWADPWYSRFDNPNLKRHHQSALMSFLYVEPREVRHEVLIRVRDLEDWTDLGLEGDTIIGIDKQAQIRNRARAFFTEHNPLKVDDALMEPFSSQAAFLKIALTGLQVIEEAQPLDLSTAIIGVILSYPVERLPQHVSVEWELFNGRVDRIPTTATDPAGPLSSFVTARDPTIEWENFLLNYEEPKVSAVVLDDGRSIGVPMVSLALLIFSFGTGVLAVRPALLPRRGWIALSALGAVAAVLFVRLAIIEVQNPFAGPPDEKTTAQIVMGVLKNVNHAFIEKNPDTLRQALGVIVAGDRHEDVETELERALAIKVPGGGIARVDAIEDLVVKETAELGDSPGFSTLAEWTARASAGHWGHAHRRAIRFRALMELVEVEGVWKLTGLTVVDAKQQS